MTPGVVSSKEGWQERLASVDPNPPKRSFLWAVVFSLGFAFLIGPCLPGWENLERGVGMPDFLRVLVAFLFFFCASFLRSIHRLKSDVKELTESVAAANSALYGKNWKAERNAVSLLIGLLSSPKEDLRKKARENLKTLTGVDFEFDVEKWKAWWEENRSTFRRKR